MEKVSYDPRVPIRSGLLLALAEKGITPNDLYSKYTGLAKLADAGLTNVVDVGGALSGAAKGLSTLLLDYPLAATIASGSAAGLGAGWGIGKLMQLPPHDDISDLKNQELIKELKYQTLTQKLKQRHNKI